MPIRIERKRAVLVIASLFLIVAIVGCGDNSGLPERAAVSGTVTFQGKPLAGATVTFAPDKAGVRGATGLTDEQGAYTLSSFDTNDGAVVGSYKVGIALVEASAQDEFGTPGKRAKSLIPPKYGIAEKSGLTAVVESGKSNTFDFKLQ